MKKIRILFATALLTVSSSLMADTLRLNVGIWPGNLDPELQDRFFYDDLVGGASFGRYNQAWENKSMNRDASSKLGNLYPFGVQYFKPMGPGSLVIGGNYTRYTPDYKFQGFSAAPAISLVNLKNYKATDFEAEAGYKLGLLEDKVFVTPKAGFRWHTQEYSYDELTIGNGVTAISLASPFKASAQGLYIGAGLQFNIDEKFSVIADYVFTSPILGSVAGAMTDDRTVVGVGAPCAGGASGNTACLDKATGSYQVDITRWMIGVQYNVSEDLHLMAGLRQEKQRTSYPNYTNIPIVISASGAQIGANIVSEYLTDSIFWKNGYETTKGLIFLGLSYDLPL